MSLWDAPTSENRVSVGWSMLAAVVGYVKVGALWCCEPVPEFDLGVLKHLRLLL